MQHLIALDVHTPIAGALFQREVGVMRHRETRCGHRLVPFRFDDADFWIADLLHCRQRAIRGARHVDNDFIAQRQQRANGRHKGITQHQAIANESEAADFHAEMFAESEMGRNLFRLHLKS